MKPQALRIYAGRTARQHLRERGLSAGDVRVVPAAAAGPKGLVLHPLDRLIFGHWLARGTQPVHLLGASIGAWRMACACLPDADAALAQMAHDYIHQRYEHTPPQPPAPRHVSEVFGAKLVERFGHRCAEVLGHPRFRLHVFTSRGRHWLLRRPCRWRMPLGCAGAFAANAVSRRALGAWLERVVFHDARAPSLPLHLQDFRTRQVNLSAHNLCLALLASCSIPFALDAVQDIPGAPPGAYWDGGLTDYHLHLDYASMSDGLVLYPHFQRTIIPGYLDTLLPHRQRAGDGLGNVVVLAPDPDWVRRALPNGKLPDLDDFKAYANDVEARIAVWSRAVAESQRLAEEFAAVLEQGSIDALPLE
jgi:hypothetical protein